MAQRLPFSPDFIQRPGEYLEEVLEARVIKKVDFAARCGRPTKTISEIIAGKTAITPETSLQFERVLGIKAALWLAYESNYRLSLARRNEQRQFNDEKTWALKFPIKEIRKRGVIADECGSSIVEQLLSFFGVGGKDACEEVFLSAIGQAAFRESETFKSHPEATAVWLRIGEIEAQKVNCEPFDEKKFRETLPRIREFSRMKFEEFWPQLVALCASCGVAVVLVSEFEHTHLSGAARWLAKDKALIQLSNRYNRDDQFWFSFFHEAGHILLHGKKSLFIDDDDNVVSDEEAEANTFAGAMLIPRKMLSEFFQQHPKGSGARFTEDNLRKFADYCGISPGVVLGQFQKRKYIPYSSTLNKRLKVAVC